MERIIIKLGGDQDEMLDWMRTARDGDLFDMDVLNHGSTFCLNAVGSESRSIAYLPIQQPMMLESLACKPGIDDARKSLALSRMVEYAVGEAYRRDVGEIYFLTKDADTEAFALRHNFKALPDGLKAFRLNLLETFGS
jgi:hypothetical protein